MKKLILKVFVALVSVAFAALLIFVSVPGLTFNSTVKAAGVPIIGLHCLVLTLASLRRPFRARGRSATVFYFWCALVLVTLPFAFMKSAFGVGDVASILITVAENRTAEMVAVVSLPH